MHYFEKAGRSPVLLKVRLLRYKQDKSIYCLLPPQAFYPEGRKREGGGAEVSVITIPSFLGVRQSQDMHWQIPWQYIVYHISIKPRRANLCPISFDSRRGRASHMQPHPPSVS